jgi:hypothetical protein
MDVAEISCKNSGHAADPTDGGSAISGLPPLPPLVVSTSESIEPREQVRLALPPRSFGRAGGGIYFFECLALGFQTGPRVDVCTVEARVPEPVTNHRHIHSFGEKASLLFGQEPKKVAEIVPADRRLDTYAVYSAVLAHPSLSHPDNNQKYLVLVIWRRLLSKPAPRRKRAQWRGSAVLV